MMFVSKIKYLMNVVRFFTRNLIKIARYKKFEENIVDGFCYRGFKKSDEQQISKIYFQLNDGARFPWSRRVLYRLVGTRVMLVVVKYGNSNNMIVGMNMYYFNKRDAIEETVHEGFIGVVPEFSGKGIATGMRSQAKKHFSSNGIKGISTRISLRNFSSLNSAKKSGFEPEEKYFDDAMREERYYMICKLRGES